METYFKKTRAKLAVCLLGAGFGIAMLALGAGAPVDATAPREASQAITPSPAFAAGGNATADAAIYQRTCEPCHGNTGKGGHSEGAILPDNITAQTLSQQELRDVAAYAARLLAK